MKLFIRQSCKSSDSVLDEQRHPPDFCHETSPADFSVIQTSLSWYSEAARGSVEVLLFYSNYTNARMFYWWWNSACATITLAKSALKPRRVRPPGAQINTVAKRRDINNDIKINKQIKW